MSNNKKIRNPLLLLLTAMIWGGAFVAQSTGGDATGPYTFNCIRSLIGAVVLLPVIRVLDRMSPESRRPETTADKKNLIKGGLLCGVILFAASSLQQIGLYYGTSAGKAGFLTACYILLVPIFGMFLKKKCGWNVWLGVLITIAGLYFLCWQGTMSLEFGDVLILLCAVLYSFHILTVDHFSPLVDGVRMSCIQLFTSGCLGLIPMIGLEMGLSGESFSIWRSSLMSWNAWIPILYAGILSCGVAYTLQIVGQEGVNPTIASLIMSLESVFSVLAGWLLLNETMSMREILGCVLIFAAIVLAQIPVGRKKPAHKTAPEEA